MDLSEEQSMLRDSVTRYVRERHGFDGRMARLRAGRTFDADTWSELADLGLLAAGLPEACGGLGGGPLEVAVLMEVLGGGLLLEPVLAAAVLAGRCLIEAEEGALRQALLTDLAAGRCIPALAAFEPASRSRPTYCRTQAVAVGAGWRLEGAKCVVPGGAVADRFIVSARLAGAADDEAGISLFVLERGRAGLACTDYITLDDRPACDLALDGVQVGRADLLGVAGQGGRLLEVACDHALAASLAEAVGSMDAALALTLEHLKTRQQFGRPLAGNQALQHRLVDLHIAIEESRVMAWQAALALACEPPQAARRAVSAAKVLVGQAMRLVGQETVQMHGAIGTTFEAPIAHHFKRLSALRIEFGDADWHARRFAALTAPRPGRPSGPSGPGGPAGRADRAWGRRRTATRCRHEPAAASRFGRGTLRGRRPPIRPGRAAAGDR